MKIPITKPCIGRAEIEAVARVLESGWVSQEPKVAEFERAVAEYLGVRHAVATSSCTTALHLALLAAGIKPGDQVIVPSYTFIATANAVRYVGAEPVFVDIRPDTYNLDPALIPAAVTKRTVAVLAVDQVGLAADWDAIRAAAQESGLTVLEDAACALGAEYRGRRTGSRAASACFSFHPRKCVTTGEGGMLVTDNDRMADRARVLRSHGASVSDLARHQAGALVFEQYEAVGYNYRLSDIHAALGLAQMSRLTGIIERRRAIAAQYHSFFSRYAYLQTPAEPAVCHHSYQSYILKLRPGAPIGRDDLMQALLAREIASRRAIMAIHREPAYSAWARLKLPVTEDAVDNGLIIPLFPQMTPQEIDYLLDAFRQTLP